MSTDRTTEMLNYLSAISREIGTFRQETNARFDKVEQRLDNIEQRVTNIEQRLDNIEHRMTKVEGGMREIRRTLDIVGSGVLVQRAKIDELDERVTGLEGKRA